LIFSVLTIKLESFTSTQKDSIAGNLILQRFNKGEAIVNEGDQANSFYIIKSGSVVALKGTKEVRKMVQGETFGEQALLHNAVRGVSVKANETTEVLSIGRDKISAIFGDKMSTILNKNQLKWAFQQSPSLSKLTQLQIQKIIEKTEFKIHPVNEVIIKKGEMMDKIIVIISGSVITAPGQEPMTKGILGDSYLLTNPIPFLILNQSD